MTKKGAESQTIHYFDLGLTLTPIQFLFGFLIIHFIHSQFRVNKQLKSFMFLDLHTPTNQDFLAKATASTTLPPCDLLKQHHDGTSFHHVAKL